jgi:fructose-bisphosphate aldolase, class II
MHTLREILHHAEQQHVAVGHFNVCDTVLLNAVFASARGLGIPVLVGASEGERAFAGTRQLAALVRCLREEFDYPIFLNADHTHSLEKGLEAARAGFDSIVFDLSSLPLEENARQTRQAVEALKAIHPEMLVEGEIGDIGSGSEIHEAAPDLARGLTTPEQARHFVEETRVDILAPAVGNMHGMLKAMLTGALHKRLDIERIAQIRRATQVPLTLHGGSGTDDNDFHRAIAAGITIVHINTELRVAWRKGLQEGLANNPDEVVPYKILPAAVKRIEQVVSDRLKLFNTPASVPAAVH